MAGPRLLDGWAEVSDYLRSQYGIALSERHLRRLARLEVDPLPVAPLAGRARGRVTGWTDQLDAWAERDRSRRCA